MRDVALIMLAGFGIALALPAIALVSLELWQQVRETLKEIQEDKHEKTN